MKTQLRLPACLTLLALIFAGPAAAWGDIYAPPVGYYPTPDNVLTGAALKNQLYTIISTNDTPLSYDAVRSALQVTDADPAYLDPNNPLTIVPSQNRTIMVYEMSLANQRVSINTSAINPGGPVPGWDNGSTWNREHTWPRSRGVGSTGPDDSDLFNLRPSITAHNGDRGNLNFGGTFGLGGSQLVGGTYWYPGDLDAGMIARQEFYMAVRYNGSEANTANLELVNGNPSASQSLAQLGNLSDLINWHYLAVPDTFERRRNQVIYQTYQHNRDPFIDNPEWVWSVFVDQLNDSQLTLQGGTNDALAGSSLTVDFGRRIVGSAMPGAQNVTINKAGVDGTYYSVTASGAASSTLSGKFNAFADDVTGSKTFAVGLTGDTSVAGAISGTVTIDNLDITTQFGDGHGAKDGNDVITATLAVLDHANPSFAGMSDLEVLTLDFGSITQGSQAVPQNFDIFNLVSTTGFTAGLDFDGFSIAGDGFAFTTDLLPGGPSLPAGNSNSFLAMIDTMTPGAFSATYTLNFSDENILGATTLGSLMLTLTGIVEPANVVNADFNGDGSVDGVDLLAWQIGFGAQSGATLADGDANGDGAVNDADLAAWQSQFSGAESLAASTPVPEPATMALAFLCLLAMTPARCRG